MLVRAEAKKEEAKKESAPATPPPAQPKAAVQSPPTPSPSTSSSDKGDEITKKFEELLAQAQVRRDRGYAPLKEDRQRARCSLGRTGLKGWEGKSWLYVSLLNRLLVYSRDSSISEHFRVDGEPAPQLTCLSLPQMDATRWSCDKDVPLQLINLLGC